MIRRAGASDREQEKVQLRERALVMLAAFERQDPGPTWDQFRQLVQNSRRLTDLRTVLRELRGTMGAMSPVSRADLARELEQRFGPDAESVGDVGIVERVRRRGRIRSESEYRSVQSYADSIAGDASRDIEFLSLGALLDEYMAAPKLSNER